MKTAFVNRAARALSAVLVVALVTGVSAGADDDSFLPLKKGLKWEYFVQDADQKPTSVVRTCDVHSVGGTPYFLLSIGSGNMGGSHSSKLLSIRKDEIYMHAERMLLVKDKRMLLIKDKDKDYSPYLETPACILKNSERETEWKCSMSIKPELSLIAGDIAVENGQRDVCFNQKMSKIRLGGKEFDALCVKEVDQRKNKMEKFKVTKTSYYVKSIGLVKYLEKEETETLGTITKAEWTLVAFTDGGQVKTFSEVSVGKVELSAKVLEKEASTESVEAAPGVVTEFKKSRTITREVIYSTNLGLGAEAEARLGAALLGVKGQLTTKVMVSVEQAMGEKLSDSETREQTVKIDGNALPNAKIIWIDIYRAGIIEVTSEGKTHKVPFEFPIGTKLVIRKP